MTSKAEKLRIRRATRAGRPRKEDADRHPCGKIKTKWTEKETKVVALDARKRIHGLGESQFAGYTLGRMFLDGKITEEERLAGDEYHRHMERYYKLTGIPFPSPRAQDINSVTGSGGDVSPSLARNAREATNKFMALQGLLLCCTDGPEVKQTVFNLCVLDIETMRDMPLRQLGWLRRGLRALMKEKV